MPKNATADIINRDLSEGAVDVNSSRLYDTHADRAPAHAEGQDNPQKEYIVDAPKKGKVGAIGAAGT
jgi:hypothetical protein